MVGQNLTMLAGDGRSREAKQWPKWFAKVPSIRQKFYVWSNDFDPFQFNEASSVAVLANAATLAGYLSQTEYIVDKRHSTRGRPWRNGRCDLWVADPKSEHSWAFEAKQHFAATNLREETFLKHLQRAYNDAKAVDRNEADDLVGCLIVTPRANAVVSTLKARMDGICSKAELAFRIDGKLGPIWLAFKFVS